MRIVLTFSSLNILTRPACRPKPTGTPPMPPPMPPAIPGLGSGIAGGGIAGGGITTGGLQHAIRVSGTEPQAGDSPYLAPSEHMNTQARAQARRRRRRRRRRPGYQSDRLDLDECCRQCIRADNPGGGWGSACCG